MKILIVSATWMEVKLLADEMQFIGEKGYAVKKYEWAGNEVDILITGMGAPFATFHLTHNLSLEKYELVINTGIAGSLSSDLKIGEVVNVTIEEFADLGIENKDGFLTLFESGFMNENEFPFEAGVIKISGNNGFTGLKKVRGVTTGKSYGRASSIAELNGKFPAHVETMEGAAVFYVCSWMGIPCYQIRAISNFVEPRDPLHWDIPLALENLKKTLLHVLKNISVPVN